MGTDVRIMKKRILLLLLLNASLAFAQTQDEEKCGLVASLEFVQDSESTLVMIELRNVSDKTIQILNIDPNSQSYVSEEEVLISLFNPYDDVLLNKKQTIDLITISPEVSVQITKRKYGLKPIKKVDFVAEIFEPNQLKGHVEEKKLFRNYEKSVKNGHPQILAILYSDRSSFKSVKFEWIIN